MRGRAFPTPFMKSKANSVEDYLASLPPDRYEAIRAIRQTILENLPAGYDEGMQYGMIGYFVPHSLYPPGYHCNPKEPLPFASLASQKNHMAIYLMCLYSDPKQLDWFEKAWKKTGKKLDMGKSCVRFKRLEDVPLEIIGKAINRVPVEEFLSFYETTLASTKTRTKKRAASKK